jgi:hypothetical protein
VNGESDSDYTKVEPIDRVLSYQLPGDDAWDFESEGESDNEVAKMDEGKWTCEACNEAFGRDADLRRHLKTAEPHRPFKAFSCACNKAFSRSDALKAFSLNPLSNTAIEASEKL